MVQVNVSGKISSVREFERNGRRTFFASVESTDETGERIVIPFRADQPFAASDRAAVTLSLGSYQRAKPYVGRDGSSRATIEDVVTFTLVKVEPAKA